MGRQAIAYLPGGLVLDSLNFFSSPCLEMSETWRKSMIFFLDVRVSVNVSELQ